jgi:hypothetical protein
MVDIEHLTQDDVMTPDSPWICTHCGVGGEGSDSLFGHLRRRHNSSPKSLIDYDIVFPDGEVKA